MNTLTKIKRLALALCLATPLVSRADAMTNPVTGETETYANTFTGGSDGTGTEWNEAGNWDTSKTPFISGAGAYSSALVNGKTVSTTTSIDGWNLQAGAYNGAAITWTTLGKIQGDTNMWLTVDATSSIAINGWGGGNLGQNGKNLNYYVAAQNGVTWGENLASGTDQGLTMNYYLKGNGSVSYQTLERASHVIKAADVTLSGTSRVEPKILVSFTSTTKTFTADAAIKVYGTDGTTLATTVNLATVNTTGTTTLTTSDPVGSCELVKTSTGIVLYYVDGDPSAIVAKTYQPSININFCHGNAPLTTAADVGYGDYAVPGTSWNNMVSAGGNNGTFTTPLSTIYGIDSTGAQKAISGASVAVSGTRGSWSCSSLAAASDLRNGYVDESSSGTTPTVTVSGIPYDQYKVVVYTATDAADKTFGYVAINGTNYTYSNNAVAEDTTAWGASGAYNTAEALAEGVNVLVSPVVSGATLTVVGHRSGDNPRGCIAAVQIVKVEQQVGENDLLIELDGDKTYTFDEAKAYSGTVYVTGSGTLTFAGTASTAATLHIGPSAAVNMVGSALTPTAVTGNGTVVYDGAQPSTTLGFDNSANWTGTVWVKNVGDTTKGETETAKVSTCLGSNTTDATSNELNKWGNANSFVKFTNVRAYMAAANVPWTLILEDDSTNYAWYNNEGWTARTITIAGLKGNGTFWDINDGGCRPFLNFTDASQFTGSINATGKQVFLSGAGAGNASDLSAGRITIPANQTLTVASGKTWHTRNGLVVDGTLNVNGTLASDSTTAAVSGSGTVVFTGSAPSPTGDAWWKNSAWTGTVQIGNITDMIGRTSGYTGTYLDFNSYGNANSLVKLGNLTGWMDNYTCNVPVNLAGTLTINNGISGEVFTFKKLISSGGYITATDQSATFSIRIEDGSEYAGYIGLNSKRVIFGTGTAPDFVKGQIYVSSDAAITVPAVNTAYWAVGGIVVDGELKADNLARFGGGTNITTGDNGVFTLTSTGNGSEGETDTDYARIKGTGSLKYDGTGWRALSTNNFPTAVTLVNEQAGDILLSRALTYTVGSLAGSKNFQGNYGSGNRYLNVIQSKNTEWSGKVVNDGYSRFAGLKLDASSTGTLTLSGTASQNVALEVNGGAVNLTGTWKGATTVAGTFGGTGTLTGDLTFSDGATLKLFSSDEDGLTVTGTVTCPTEGKVTVMIPGTFEGDAVLMTADNLTVDKFALAAGAPSKATLKVVDGKLKVSAPETIAMLVNVQAGATENCETMSQAITALSEKSGNWTLYVQKGENAVDALTVQSGLTLTVFENGGTIAVTTATVANGGALTVRGGSFTTINVAGTLTVYGGTASVVLKDAAASCTVAAALVESVTVSSGVEGKVVSKSEDTNPVYTLVDAPSDTYDVTGSETLDSTGSFTVPAGTTKIKIGTYDVTAGFSIDGTTATLLAPEFVEETNKKAIDVGATTVTLNVELVPGLYYGVASGTGLTLTRPETLTQYNGENDADILAVTKPSTEKGFFKVFVDIKE